MDQCEKDLEEALKETNKGTARSIRQEGLPPNWGSGILQQVYPR